MNHLTIETSSGIVWIALVCHFAAGFTGLVAGTVALSVAKGGRLHKASGIVFAWAMIATGLIATGLALFEGKGNLVAGGVFTAYLVLTAVTTVKRLPGTGRRLDIALAIFAFALAASTYSYGLVAWQKPRHMLAGVPAGMIFFMGTVTLLAAVGDVRMIRARGLRGPRRLARHIWRMCFGLFIATGSFFIGQAKFVPAPIRVMPLLLALGIAPLALLLYWMWRVRLRRRVTGLILATQ